MPEQCDFMSQLQLLVPLFLCEFAKSESQELGCPSYAFIDSVTRLC